MIFQFIFARKIKMMTSFFKSTLGIVALMLQFITSPAQNTQNDSTIQSNIKINFGADLYSRYIWRGSQFGGNAPSLQPALSIATNHWETGIWGAYSLGENNTEQEVDIYTSYSFAHDLFTLVVTDYFFPSDTANYHYFDYKENSTGHIIEAGILYNGTKKIPITISAYVNVYGNDAATLGVNPEDSIHFNAKTGIQYSNYFEIAYSGTYNNIDWKWFTGFTLSSPARANLQTGFLGETGFYGSGPGIINTGITLSKDIALTERYSLPLTTSLIINPQSQRIYFIFGLSL